MSRGCIVFSFTGRYLSLIIILPYCSAACWKCAYRENNARERERERINREIFEERGGMLIMGETGQFVEFAFIIGRAEEGMEALGPNAGGQIPDILAVVFRERKPFDRLFFLLIGFVVRLLLCYLLLHLVLMLLLFGHRLLVNHFIGCLHVEKGKLTHYTTPPTTTIPHPTPHHTTPHTITKTPTTKKVPQSRWRLFIIAARRPNILPTFPKPTHAFPHTTLCFNGNERKLQHLYYKGFAPLLPQVTVGDAIGDIPANITERQTDFWPPWRKAKVWGTRITEYRRPPFHPYQMQMRVRPGGE